MPFDLRAVAHAYAAGVEEYTDAFGKELEANGFDRSIVERFLERCPEGGRILDAGCGPGQISAFAASTGRTTVGLDLTFEMLAAARRCGIDGALLCGDLRRLPLADDSCDAATYWFSVHNLPRAALSSALAEARRVVRPGGSLLLATHEGTGEQWHRSTWQGVDEEVVITHYASDELAAVVGDAGFEVLAVSTRPPLPGEHPFDKVFVLAS